MIETPDSVKAEAHLSGKGAHQKRELYEFGYHLSSTNTRPFSTLHIRNYTGHPVLVTDRTNIPSIIPAEKSMNGESGIILDFNREVTNLDYEMLVKLPDLKHLDPELAKAIHQFKHVIGDRFPGMKLLTRRYILPSLSAKTLKAGYFHHESDLLFSDSSIDPNNFPLHPRSEVGLLCYARDWTDAIGAIEKGNHTLLVAYVSNPKLEKMYRATPNGIQVLQTWYRPEIPSCIILRQPKIYDERNLDAPPDHFEMAEPESFSLSEASTSLNIFTNFEEAKVAAFKLRNPEIVSDTFKTQADLAKEQIRAVATSQELSSMEDKYRYEKRLATNKGATEVIKTVGLIGAGIGALVGLYKLIR